MNTNVLIGYVGLKICSILPSNNSIIKIGQKRLRAFWTKLFIDECGENVNIEKNSRFSHHTKIGSNSGIGMGARLYGTVTIGSGVMMGPECWIYTQNHATDDVKVPMYLQGPQAVKPVRIGDDVWIGGRVTILPGVKIGNGVIIGAGAVVTKDIPDFCVVVGNPARVIRNRNGDSNEMNSDLKS